MLCHDESSFTVKWSFCRVVENSFVWFFATSIVTLEKIFRQSQIFAHPYCGERISFSGIFCGKKSKSVKTVGIIRSKMSHRQNVRQLALWDICSSRPDLFQNVTSKYFGFSFLRTLFGPIGIDIKQKLGFDSFQKREANFQSWPIRPFY